MSETLHGACLCGRITYDVHEPRVMGTCHCTRCTRWTGSTGSTVVVAAARNFKLTQGQEWLKKYQEAGFADRHFCGHCGSGVYSDGGDNYFVCAGGLRDIKHKVAFHCQVAYKASWDEIGGNAPQFPEWPPS